MIFKLVNKFGFLVVFSCFCFSLHGQVQINVSVNDTLTTVSFQNSLIDTILYFVIPNDNQKYSLCYQYEEDTQYVHTEQEVFYFKDCKGLKVTFRGNCSQQKVTILLRHNFSTQNQEVSSVFYPAYQQLFANFQGIGFYQKNTSLLLIVSPNLFVSSLSEFVQQKNQKGIQTQILTITSSLTSDSIQKMICNMYSLYHPDYLLLIGDDDLIPTYHLTDGLSDERFALIEGKDDFPEMIVGRLSVNTLEELIFQIKKIENRNSNNFSKTAAHIASENYSGNTGIYDWQYLRAIKNHLLTKEFTTVNELYDGSQGEDDEAGNPSEETIINRINKGVSLINYLGYGSYDVWGSGNISTQSLENLTNTTEFPIVIAGACLNGYFADRECLAEKWMNVSINDSACGAAACLMFSSLIDWDAAVLAQQSVNENLPNTDSNCSLGNIYLQTYVKMITQLERSKDALSWIFFGDPSMSVYPEKASDIIRYPGENELTIYPNPAVNQCIITSDKQLRSIQLFSLTGQKLLDKTLQTQTTIVDISNLKTGVYFIKINVEDGSLITKKIGKR